MFSRTMSHFRPLYDLTLVAFYFGFLFHGPIFFAVHFLFSLFLLKLLSVCSTNTPGRLLSFICLFAIFIFTHIIAFNACCLGNWGTLGSPGSMRIKMLARLRPRESMCVFCFASESDCGRSCLLSLGRAYACSLINMMLSLFMVHFYCQQSVFCFVC